jgi:stalled ribosome alternative rescue factor ArfA
VRERSDSKEKKKVQMMKHFVIFAMRIENVEGGKGSVGREMKSSGVALWKNKYFILFSRCSCIRFCHLVMMIRGGGGRRLL